MGEVYYRKQYLEEVSACPVCEEKGGEAVYSVTEGVHARRCGCGALYCDHRLTREGLAEYWKDYQLKEHGAVAEECALRRRMYEVDYAYIARFLKGGSRVLDVGCADGLFLDLFAAAGHDCHGVEFGHEAALAASCKYPVREGNFPDLDMEAGYDLVIFRGVLQYLQKPRLFFQKAAFLLNAGGLVFITAQPNMDSFCHKIFREKFRFRLTPCDCVGYTPASLTAEFALLGCEQAGLAFFYEETPYADPARDVAAVRRALTAREQGLCPQEVSPPFWGNMMTLVFRKR